MNTITTYKTKIKETMDKYENLKLTINKLRQKVKPLNIDIRALEIMIEQKRCRRECINSHYVIYNYRTLGETDNGGIGEGDLAPEE